MNVNAFTSRALILFSRFLVLTHLTEALFMLGFSPSTGDVSSPRTWWEEVKRVWHRCVRWIDGKYTFFDEYSCLTSDTYFKEPTCSFLIWLGLYILHRNIDQINLLSSNRNGTYHGEQLHLCSCRPDTGQFRVEDVADQSVSCGCNKRKHALIYASVPQPLGRPVHCQQGWALKSFTPACHNR